MYLKISRYIQFLPIAILLVFCIAIGLATFKDYGKSYDEDSIQLLAGQSLAAYKTGYHPIYGSIYGDNLNDYGPSYGMGVYIAVQLISRVFSTIAIADLWHFAYFITFQVGVLCIYLLAKRWLSGWAALSVALLFATQPLLWGHAFINPKDTPFMTFFMASILSGLWMCDRIFGFDRETFTILYFKHLAHLVVQNWQKIPKRYKRFAIASSAVWVLSIVLLAVGAGAINNWIAILLQKMYLANPQTLIGRLFTRFAQHAGNISVDLYVHKAQAIFLRLKNIYFILGTIGIIWLYHSALPWAFRLPKKKGVLFFLKQFLTSFAKPPVIIAGVILGLTTSIRVLGPLAGFIITCYALFRKKNALPSLLAYAALAIIIMYLTWPYLWTDPINHFTESLTMMSSYPWLGRVLFDGIDYSPGNLPWSYLPTLLLIQFTEPAIILFGIGIVLTTFKFFGKKYMALIGLTLIWFIIPVSFIIITKRPIYDNFRQLLFLLPPIFLLCGIALDAIFRLVRKKILNLIIIILVIFPGGYSIVQLHPYEYIYYNNFVGGVKGAFRYYPTDYWFTSFRYAAEYLNETAPQGARILSWGDNFLVKEITRRDLIVESEYTNSFDLTGGYNYAILSSRGDSDTLYSYDKPIFSIQRNGAILVVLKQLSPSSSP